MPDDLSVLRKPPFDKAIADLEELMTQSGRAFLIGAGCSKCAGLPLMAELTSKSLASAKLNPTTKEILTALKKQYDGAAEANIEDFLSELVDLIAIAERRTSRGASKNKVDVAGKGYDVTQLKDASEQIKQAIAETIDQPVTIQIHWDFVRAVHRPLRPGKPTSERPVDYLVLNYDTLIEDALALEKLPYTDGLRGGTTAWWDVQTFTANGMAARVLKLHGSINWSELSDDILPRRISKKLQLSAGGERNILIWPASTKYRETQRDPYAQLASITRDILRPQPGTQTVLVICGYRFGDSHVNLEIDRGLRESSGQLTIVVFTNEEKPEGQMKIWLEEPSIREQVRVYAKKGFFHGVTSAASTDELPWWKFENVVRLLRGER
jgi:hypothetical protein